MSRRHQRKQVRARAHPPSGFTEKIATVNGVKINYKIAGRGPVVVLLHGYTQTSHMWKPLMRLLATSHTVIAPDLRGAAPRSARRGGMTRRPWPRTCAASCTSSAMSK